MKKLILCGVAAFAAFAVTGCRMCTDPILNDPTCIEDSHYKSVAVDPENLSWRAPKVAESLELFRPVFKAGSRITVTGEGTSEEIATYDAMAKFMAKANCDYIVAVARVVNEKTHPTWRIFATTNYTVTLSGIPIVLDKLSCETLKPEAVDKKAPAAPPVCKCEKPVKQIIEVKCNHVCSQPQVAPQAPALLKLTDIDVKISAKGTSDEKAGIIFPVKPVAAK